jgi:hypothetical protein
VEEKLRGVSTGGRVVYQGIPASWTLSEIIGFGLWNNKVLNPKHLPARSRFGEGRRNPKQYLMSKIQMIQTKGIPPITFVILFLSLGHLILEFV